MCDNCDWSDHLEECNDILDDLDNEWCSSTIEGIKKWVEENEHITDKQIAAIENIQDAIARKSENDF